MYLQWKFIIYITLATMCLSVIIVYERVRTVNLYLHPSESNLLWRSLICLSFRFTSNANESFLCLYSLRSLKKINFYNLLVYNFSQDAHRSGLAGMAMKWWPSDELNAKGIAAIYYAKWSKEKYPPNYFFLFGSGSKNNRTGWICLDEHIFHTYIPIMPSTTRWGSVTTSKLK